MKKAILFLILSAFPALAQINPSNQMATIVFGMTNAVGRPDTNYFILYQVDGVVLANGGVRTIGFAQRCYPNSIGVFVTNLMTGFYQITNAFLGKGIIIQVPPNTNSYAVSLQVLTNSIAISGFNTYQMTGVLGLTSSNGSLTISPGNGVGFVDVATTGSAITTNVITKTIIVTNPPESASLTSASLYFTNSFGFVVAIQPSQGHIADFEILAGATNVPLVSVASINSNSVSLYEPLDLFSTSNGQEWFYDSTGTNVIAGYNGSNWFTANMSTAPGSNSFFTTFGNSRGVTNHMLTVISGNLIDYWSDGTNVYFQQLSPDFGSLIWTNSNGQVTLTTSTNDVFLGDVSQLGVFAAELLELVATNESFQRAVQFTKTINGSSSSRFGLQVILNGTPTSGGIGTTDGAINGANQAGGIQAAGSTYFADGAIGLDGISGNNTDGATNVAFGTSGYANGHEGLLVGVIGESDASINGTTNIGGLFNVLTEGKSGSNVALYVEARISPVADGSDDPKIESAVSVFDSRETGMDLVYWRTNNGTHVASLDKNGDMTARQFVGKTGYLFHSNTVANLPTLAKGDAFLWSSNGVFFAIRSDASGTILTNPVAMLPISPTNVLLVAGANISFTTNGNGSVTIDASGNVNITVITNTTFYSTNAYITTVYAQTNYSTNLFFVNGKGNTLIITNISIEVSATNKGVAASSAVITDSHQVETNAVNAHGVFTNSASGPPSFGLLANTEMQNSSLTVAGTANQISVSGGGPVSLGGTVTISIPNPFIAPGPISATQVTNTSFGAVGVVTNDAGGKTYTTPTLPNVLLANSSVTINGTANQINGGGSVSLGGTLTLSTPQNINAGASPAFNGVNFTNLQGGTVVGGTKEIQFDASFMWPGDTLTATFTTNTPGAGSASIQSAGPSFKSWQFSTTSTNQVLLQVPMPSDWDGNTTIPNFRIHLVSGTNSAVANAITNIWSVSAARVGTALGAAITITNNLPGGTGLIETNFDFPNLVIAGSPKPGNYVLFQIQGWGGKTPFSSSNILELVESGMRYNVTNIQNNAIQWP